MKKSLIFTSLAAAVLSTTVIVNAEESAGSQSAADTSVTTTQAHVIKKLVIEHEIFMIEFEDLSTFLNEEEHKIVKKADGSYTFVFEDHEYTVPANKVEIKKEETTESTTKSITEASTKQTEASTESTSETSTKQTEATTTKTSETPSAEIPFPSNLVGTWTDAQGNTITISSDGTGTHSTATNSFKSDFKLDKVVDHGNGIYELKGEFKSIAGFMRPGPWGIEGPNKFAMGFKLSEDGLIPTQWEAAPTEEINFQNVQGSEYHRSSQDKKSEPSKDTSAPSDTKSNDNKPKNNKGTKDNRKLVPNGSSGAADLSEKFFSYDFGGYQVITGFSKANGEKTELIAPNGDIVASIKSQPKHLEDWVRWMVTKYEAGELEPVGKVDNDTNNNTFNNPVSQNNSSTEVKDAFDFSSLYGTWTTPKSKSLTLNGLYFEDKIAQKQADGSYWIYTPSKYGHDDILSYYPAGVAFANTDSNQDRLFQSNGPIAPNTDINSLTYYRGKVTKPVSKFKLPSTGETAGIALTVAGIATLVIAFLGFKKKSSK